jgi:hypothetical protein
MIRAIKRAAKKALGMSDGSLVTAADRLRIHEIGAIDKGMQILLSMQYKQMLANGGPMPKFGDVEFRAYSQNGEDGILLYIFSVIGTTSKTAVEICAGNGIQCNTANLIINHGWTALLADGDERLVSQGREFYQRCPDTFCWPPTFLHTWITDNGFGDEVDLLSLDVDGVDYWIWKAIDCISPRCVVVECQDMWGPDKAVTVPYSSDFSAESTGTAPGYCGASLPAFVKLAREKGYRLVGSIRYGFNAFFIRDGIAEDVFPELPASECLRHPRTKHHAAHTLPKVIDREWIEV